MRGVGINAREEQEFFLVPRNQMVPKAVHNQSFNSVSVYVSIVAFHSLVSFV